MRRPDALAPLALIALVVAALVVGLLTVGGPGQGRLEKRDETRLSNLDELRRYVICLADARDKTLPETLGPADICNSDPPLTDPYTGQPYVYERVSDTSFRLCAGFEDATGLAPYRGVDAATGCLQYSYIRPATR